MTSNVHWVIKGKQESPLGNDPRKGCPYLRKSSALTAYAGTGQCLAWTGFSSRFSDAEDAEDMGEYCNINYPACPRYRATAGGERLAGLRDDEGIGAVL